MSVVEGTDLTTDEATELVESIKRHVGVVWRNVERAYFGRAWIALGYGSWDEMCDAEFDGARLRLPREDRREVVASLADAGMSTRAIAAAIGVSRDTAHKDIARVRNLTPAPTVAAEAQDSSPRHGADDERCWCSPPCPGFEPPQIDAGDADDREASGGSGDAVHPSPASTPSTTGLDGKTYPKQKATAKPRRRPIVDDIGKAATDLLKFSERIDSILHDGRFDREKEELAAPLRNQLTLAIGALQRLLDQLDTHDDKEHLNV